MRSPYPSRAPFFPLPSRPFCACPRLARGLMKPEVPLPIEYVQQYHSVRADVQDRHPVGMQYHLGYLKAQTGTIHSSCQMEGLGGYVHPDQP